MILLLDNYDSFTYNLYHLFAIREKDILVVRNDEISVDEIVTLNPERIIISPGPGRPENAGISENLIRAFAFKIPILGICLGHQAIAEVFSTPVVRSEHVVHGKRSLIIHSGSSIFKGIPEHFHAGRYHSLKVDEKRISENIEVIARTDDGTVMAIHVKGSDVYGLQFHPESILTEYGEKIRDNFLEIGGEK